MGHMRQEDSQVDRHRGPFLFIVGNMSRRFTFEQPCGPLVQFLWTLRATNNSCMKRPLGQRVSTDYCEGSVVTEALVMPGPRALIDSGGEGDLRPGWRDQTLKDFIAHMKRR